jgi:aspartyl-tRNA synthetase
MKRKYSGEIGKNDNGKEVVVKGWIHEMRDLGGLRFLIIRDREGKVQVTAPRKKVTKEVFELIKGLSRESVVEISGVVKEEPKAPGGFEIIPDKIKVLSRASSPLLLEVTEKVPAELDTRLDSRFLDLRRPRIQAIFRIRHQVQKAVRDFLERNGFIEINTPKIVATATEGGAALFPISYFEKEAFLNQSPQLYKQMMMAAGFERVYEIGPIFRAEEHNTTRHLNEATSIDIEMSFANHEDVMKILEKMVVHVYRQVEQHCERYLEWLGITLEIPDAPFPRITYEEAIEIASKEEEIEWGDDLTTKSERIIGETIGEHYFIVDWPTEIKPYYTMPYENKPDLCKAFDLMHPKLELASGAQRIHDVQLLEKRIADQGLSPENFEFYLTAFRYGIPPHAGWGLGCERLVMTMLDLNNIREAVLFPRDRQRLTP